MLEIDSPIRKMARMHSGKKGKARSYKPAGRKDPSWNKYKAKEIEALVVKLAKNGESASQMGIHLRDAYGIPDVKAACKKTITKIMEEQKVLPDIPEDLMALLRKEVFLRKHIEKNNHDETSKRGLILAQSKAKRLAKYYRMNGKLPENWKYDPSKIALLVE